MELINLCNYIRNDIRDCGNHYDNDIFIVLGGSNAQEVPSPCGKLLITILEEIRKVAGIRRKADMPNLILVQNNEDVPIATENIVHWKNPTFSQNLAIKAEQITKIFTHTSNHPPFLEVDGALTNLYGPIQQFLDFQLKGHEKYHSSIENAIKSLIIKRSQCFPDFQILVRAVIYSQNCEDCLSIILNSLQKVDHVQKFITCLQRGVWSPRSDKDMMVCFDWKDENGEKYKENCWRLNRDAKLKSPPTVQNLSNGSSPSSSEPSTSTVSSMRTSDSSLAEWKVNVLQDYLQMISERITELGKLKNLKNQKIKPVGEIKNLELKKTPLLRWLMEIQKTKIEIGKFGFKTGDSKLDEDLEVTVSEIFENNHIELAITEIIRKIRPDSYYSIRNSALPDIEENIIETIAERIQSIFEKPQNDDNSSGEEDSDDSDDEEIPNTKKRRIVIDSDDSDDENDVVESTITGKTVNGTPRSSIEDSDEEDEIESISDDEEVEECSDDSQKSSQEKRNNSQQNTRNVSIEDTIEAFNFALDSLDYYESERPRVRNNWDQKFCVFCFSFVDKECDVHGIDELTVNEQMQNFFDYVEILDKRTFDELKGDLRKMKSQWTSKLLHVEGTSGSMSGGSKQSSSATRNALKRKSSPSFEPKSKRATSAEFQISATGRVIKPIEKYDQIRDEVKKTKHKTRKPSPPVKKSQEAKKRNTSKDGNKFVPCRTIEETANERNLQLATTIANSDFPFPENGNIKPRPTVPCELQKGWSRRECWAALYGPFYRDLQAHAARKLPIPDSWENDNKDSPQSSSSSGNLERSDFSDRNSSTSSSSSANSEQWKRKNGRQEANKASSLYEKDRRVVDRSSEGSTSSVENMEDDDVVILD